MKRYTPVLFLILILTSLSFAQSSAKDDPAIKAAVRQLIDAQIAYDAKVLDKLFTADYIEISPLGEFDPRDKVMGFYTPEAKSQAGPVNVTVEDTEYSIRNYGKYAIAITRLNYAMTAAGKPLPPRSIRDPPHRVSIVQPLAQRPRIARRRRQGPRAQPRVRPFPIVVPLRPQVDRAQPREPRPRTATRQKRQARKALSQAPRRPIATRLRSRAPQAP